MRPQVCQIEGNNYFPQPAGSGLANATLYVFNLNRCKSDDNLP